MPEPASLRRAAHGTVRSYWNGCHCFLCRRAYNQYQSAWLARRKKEGVRVHGTTYGYNLGCRCPSCVQVMRFRHNQRKRLAGRAQAEEIKARMEAFHELSAQRERA